MASNQYAKPWTVKETQELIRLYKFDLTYEQIGKRISRSRDTVRKKVRTLRDQNLLPPRMKSNETCNGDCDHCIYDDCKASCNRALQVQRKQDAERYEKLPDCDKRAIQWQIEHGLRETRQGKRKESAWV